MGLEITLKDVFKVYKLGKIEVQALRGLSAHIMDGEIVSIIGPSGSGKTTLLNLIGGLDRPTAGSIIVGEIEVSRLSSRELTEYRRRNIGYIFQNLNLIPTLTALENVELPMIALGLPRGERVERARQLLDVVGLSHRMRHKPDELSGGEQQRVAIAAALANDPPVILADEPTGELDTLNARLITEYLVKVSRDFKKTTVIVTHDPNVARAADRIMKIEDGSIKEVLTPSNFDLSTSAFSYIDQIKARLHDLDMELNELDEMFRKSKISGEEYMNRRTRLLNIKMGLQEELHRAGAVT
jgi:putative ABC transport system ATP-binding protein